MARIHVSIGGNALAAIDMLAAQFRSQVLPRALARSRRDLTRLYIRHIKAEIRERTRRRTGALLRVSMSVQVRARDLEIEFTPTFPATAYSTPFGRGRRGASKSGQYAFVVNHSRRFIEVAAKRFQSDPRVQEILNKHVSFIVNSIIRRTRS